MKLLLSSASLGKRNGVPEPLENGDHLRADEFLRRYEAMPGTKKAELIEGIVYMPSPVRINAHAKPDNLIQTWLGTYAIQTPGTEAGTNSTVKLGVRNVPQPDAFLRIEEDCGGASKVNDQDYLVGPPELIVEIAASTSSLDRHAKLRAYRREAVKEYLIWRTTESEFDWFLLSKGKYEPQHPDNRGLCRSSSFPGLVLNVPALLRRDGATVLATLQTAIKSKAHRTFVAELASRRRGSKRK